MPRTSRVCPRAAYSNLLPPEGAGIRNDAGFEVGDEVPINYDAMLAKLIVYAPDRPSAVRAPPAISLRLRDPWSLLQPPAPRAHRDIPVQRARPRSASSKRTISLSLSPRSPSRARP